MRRFFLLLGLLPCASVASTPTGQQFGAWHVSSINSLSGTAGDDAAAGLKQARGCTHEGYDCSELGVRWHQGWDVVVFIDIAGCRQENDFEASFSVPVDKWLTDHRDVEAVVDRSFKNWLTQARLQCLGQEKASVFEMANLKSALRNLTQRIGWFAK